MRDANAFDYIAFDQSSGEILSHGTTVEHAAILAELNEPTPILTIVRAGKAGIDIWEEKWTYPRVLEALGAGF